MKIYDEVRVLKDKKEYEKYNIHKGDVGTIWFSEIRYNCFDVLFEDKDGRYITDCQIHIEDLEVVKESDITNQEIMEGLPTPDPHWWCKVENGYILNLLDEKKNKIPYDYNS